MRQDGVEQDHGADVEDADVEERFAILGPPGPVSSITSHHTGVLTNYYHKDNMPLRVQAHLDARYMIRNSFTSLKMIFEKIARHTHTLNPRDTKALSPSCARVNAQARTDLCRGTSLIRNSPPP